MMSEQKMREALIAAYMAGNQHGHNSTVEGYWSEAEDVAEEYADEALSQREAQEPVAWGVMKRGGRVWYVNDSISTCQGYATHYGHRLENGMDLDQEVVPLYTAPPSREVPEEWREVVRDLMDVMVCHTGHKGFVYKRAAALLASKGGVR